MRKSSTIIFSFLFAFLMFAAEVTIGGVFDFTGNSGQQIIEKTSKNEKVEKGGESKLEKKEDTGILLFGDKNLDSQSESSKSLNIGIELTKALFGKYLKKEE